MDHEWSVIYKIGSTKERSLFVLCNFYRRCMFKNRILMLRVPCGVSVNYEIDKMNSENDVTYWKMCENRYVIGKGIKKMSRGKILNMNVDVYKRRRWSKNDEWWIIWLERRWLLKTMTNKGREAEEGILCRLLINLNIYRRQIKRTQFKISTLILRLKDTSGHRKVGNH